MTSSHVAHPQANVGRWVPAPAYAAAPRTLSGHAGQGAQGSKVVNLPPAAGHGNMNPAGNQFRHDSVMSMPPSQVMMQDPNSGTPMIYMQNPHAQNGFTNMYTPPMDGLQDLQQNNYTTAGVNMNDQFGASENTETYPFATLNVDVPEEKSLKSEMEALKERHSSLQDELSELKTEFSAFRDQAKAIASQVVRPVQASVETSVRNCERKVEEAFGLHRAMGATVDKMEKVREIDQHAYKDLSTHVKAIDEHLTTVESHEQESRTKVDNIGKEQRLSAGILSEMETFLQNVAQACGELAAKSPNGPFTAVQALLDMVNSRNSGNED